MKILSFFLLSLVYLQSAFAIDEYPEWFLYPARFPELTVGLSYQGTPAVIDAERMYCVYNYCTVDGYLETVSGSDVSYLKNTDYYYYFDHDEYIAIKNNLFYVDGFCNSTLTEDVVVAFSTNPNYKLKSKTLKIRDISKPTWTNRSSWEDDEYYYGVGMFTASGNENDAWKTAEEQAFYNILTSISVKIYSLSMLTNSTLEDSYLNYIRLVLEFTVKNIQTMQRWIDVDNNYTYTLVRIKKADITEQEAENDTLDEEIKKENEEQQKNYNSNYEIDYQTNTVLDKVNNLRWSFSSDSPNDYFSFRMQNIGSFWRLPSLAELQHFFKALKVDKAKGYDFLSPLFEFPKNTFVLTFLSSTDTDTGSKKQCLSVRPSDLHTQISKLSKREAAYILVVRKEN